MACVRLVSKNVNRLFIRSENGGHLFRSENVKNTHKNNKFCT